MPFRRATVFALGLACVPFSADAVDNIRPLLVFPRKDT